MILETIFSNGSSYATKYEYSSEPEAIQHAWQVARLTGKEVATIHRVRSLQAARAVANTRQGVNIYRKS